MHEKMKDIAILIVAALLVVGCSQSTSPPPKHLPMAAVPKAQVLADEFITAKGIDYELEFRKVTDEGSTWLVDYTILKPTQLPGYLWIRVNKKTGTCELVPGK